MNPRTLWLVSSSPIVGIMNESQGKMSFFIWVSSEMERLAVAVKCRTSAFFFQLCLTNYFWLNLFKVRFCNYLRKANGYIVRIPMFRREHLTGFDASLLCWFSNERIENCWKLSSPLTTRSCRPFNSESSSTLQRDRFIVWGFPE